MSLALPAELNALQAAIWLDQQLFAGRPMPGPPDRTDDRNVSDVTYEIVDRRDDKRP